MYNHMQKSLSLVTCGTKNSIKVDLNRHKNEVMTRKIINVKNQWGIFLFFMTWSLRESGYWVKDVQSEKHGIALEKGINHFRGQVKCSFWNWENFLMLGGVWPPGFLNFFIENYQEALKHKINT